MAKRRIHFRKFGRCSLAIHYDSGEREYVVTTKAPAPWAGTYYTTEKSDARGTAADILKRMRRAGACR